MRNLETASLLCGRVAGAGRWPALRQQTHLPAADTADLCPSINTGSAWRGQCQKTAGRASDRLRDQVASSKACTGAAGKPASTGDKAAVGTGSTPPVVIITTLQAGR